MHAFEIKNAFDKFCREHGDDYVNGNSTGSIYLFRDGATCSNDPLGLWFREPPEDEQARAKLQMQYIETRLPLIENDFYKLKSDIRMSSYASVDHVSQLKKLADEIKENRQELNELKELCDLLGANAHTKHQEYAEEVARREHQKIVAEADKISI